MPAIVDRARSRLRRLCGTAPGDRPPSHRLALAAVAVVGAVVATAVMTHGYGSADLVLYRDSIRSWTAGDGLYAYRSTPGNLGFPLSPTAAFALLPVAALPPAVAGWLVALAGWVALALALVALTGPVARRYVVSRRLTVAAAVTLAAATEPVRAAIGLGTLDLVLLGLVSADVMALRRQAWARSRATWFPGRPAWTGAVRQPARRDPVPRLSAPHPAGVRLRGTGRSVRETVRRGWATGAWAGAGIGLATAIGVSPAIFIGYLAVTRQGRAALTASVTALAAGAAALLLAPRQTAAWFTDVLWRLDRTGPTDATANQSLAGILARLYDSATTPVLLWLSFAMLLLAVGLIRAKSAHADGDEIAAFTLTGLTGAAVGPVTGTHELVWVLPALLILLDAAARRHADVRRAGRALRRFPRRLAGAGYAAGAILGYLLFVAAPVWAYEHRLPETSHHADGLVGALGENAFGLALVLLVTALPWRPGTAPAIPVHRFTPAVRRPIPPARRPQQSRS